MPIPYAPHQRFLYNGTRYEIKTVTPGAVEIASQAGQSLWVAIADFEKELGIKGKAGLFAWHVAQREPPSRSL